MRLAIWASLIGAMLPGVTGCGQEQTWEAVDRMIASDFPNVHHISTDSLAAWLSDSSRRPPLILDARESAEYAVSHLPGAIRVDPDATDFSFLDSLNHEGGIVAYCSVGYRSSGLAEKLEEAGYTDVFNLQGSIFRWANEGRPVYRDGVQVSEVHPYDRLWGTLLQKELRRYEAGK